jgi:hypothetical protein
MPRYFTLAQANRLLPEIDRLLALALSHRQRYLEAEAEIERLRRNINTLGGVDIDPSELRLLAAARDKAARAMKHALDSIRELGVQVKDLDAGLIDFPTLYHGEEVLMCWRRVEAHIDYWHRLEDGFRGRRAMDGEFLDNHRGGGVH